MRSISQPAGKAARKYPPKKATWMNEDWKSLSPKASRKRGIKTSLRLTPSAQRKKRQVMSAKGTRNRRSVKGADWFARRGRDSFVISSVSGQGAVEVHVPAVHKQELPGSVAGQGRKQEKHGGGDLFRCGHPLAQRYVAYDRAQFLPRIGEATEPLLVKRGHHLRRNDCIHSNLGRKQFGCPLPGEGENAALGRRVARGVSLSGQRHLGGDVDDCATCLLQRRQRIMRHVVIVKQVPFERCCKLFRTAAFQADAVVNPGIVHQSIEMAEELHCFVHCKAALLRPAKVDGHEPRPLVA